VSLVTGSTIITPVSEPICYLPKSKGGVDCSRNPLGEIVVSIDEVSPPALRAERHWLCAKHERSLSQP
jgi:hypothetical protein